MIKDTNFTQHTAMAAVKARFEFCKAILRVGSQYVTDAPISFGYTTLSSNFKDAKVFYSFEDASNYASLLAMECEIVGV